MRRARAALGLCAALALAGPAARAQTPVTRLGADFGPRTNMGALGNRYALGWFVGIEAGLMPSWFGIVWSLQYSNFSSSDNRNPDSTLEMWDLDFGVRARLALRADAPFFLWSQLGVDLRRTRVPIEPDLATSYVGPTVRVGGEWVVGPVILSVGADYGLILGGPSGLRLVFFLGFGD